MDGVHNTRIRNALETVEVIVNLIPETLRQVQPEAVPQPTRRGRGRGRVTRSGRGRGQNMANVEPMVATPQPEPQVLPNLIAVLTAVQ